MNINFIEAPFTVPREIIFEQPRQILNSVPIKRNKFKFTLYDFYKRGFDILASCLILIILSPLLVFITCYIRLVFLVPAILKQKRLTKDGKVFTMYKFRTMCMDAESSSGAVFATKNDPRITSFGKMLRRSRLDELLQLYNVLIGEMSIIGPRPERPEMASALIFLHPKLEDRLTVLAGLTGLAQIRIGYSSTTRQYRHKLRCDLIYIKNRCVLLDFWILFKTVAVVLSGKGAC